MFYYEYIIFYYISIETAYLAL